MKLFVSAGEPSGDLHGANLIKELKARAPSAACLGFGGDRMKTAGCEVIYPLCDHAVMGFTGALAAVPRLWGVYKQFERMLVERKPDAVVLIDYPGFHWWLAAKAKKLGVPVVWFVPPQIWAWATHRVKRMRKNVDHVLCTLPFEEAWYAERGVRAHYIGHPFFDEVASHKLDAVFCAQQRVRGGRIVALLPGSRNKEVKRNGRTLVKVAEELAAEFKDVRCLFACFKPHQAGWIQEMIGERRLPVEVHVGKTPEIMSLAHSCAAVSGSVSLELLHHNVPTVITYRANPILLWLAARLKRVPYITLVNLLAGKELYPEFPTARDESASLLIHLRHWLTDEPARQALKAELKTLLAKVGQPGACAAAADFILKALSERSRQRLAA